MLNTWTTARSIIVVGGGFSGTLFALAASAVPGFEVVLVERERVAGPGLAYGACDDLHLLNVPVARMELGLQPSFAEWLLDCGADLTDALAEADGDLSRAFVPRALFGAYLAERLEAALASGGGRIRRIRGEVVRAASRPVPCVVLADGRRVEGTQVVLATGNLPPKPPRCRDGGFYDSLRFVPDPWRGAELERIPRDAPLLLIGSGLTMVDVVLKLLGQGHGGAIVAVSRHGFLPGTHLRPALRGHAAPPFEPQAASSPRRALRLLREEVERALAAGIPWQDVMDAVRPSLAAIWSQWSLKEKARFLRHARSVWDVHRHRMAPRVEARLAACVASGQLDIVAGRIADFRPGPRGVTATVRRRGAPQPLQVEAAYVINCTGPRTDLSGTGLPLFRHLLEEGRLVPDSLGLGVETRNCAVVDRFGQASGWLFAIGPLTRPAWWEITAVPEIAAQIHRLVRNMADEGRNARPDRGSPAPFLSDFADLGAGI